MAQNINTKVTVDTKDAKKSIDGLKSAFKGLIAAASVKEFVSLGDEFTQITNRLKSVSDSTEEASSAFDLVKKVAGETRSGLGPVADLFTDLTIATEEMGLSQERVAGVAGTFSKALKISGADANATSGAIRQFGQALASGVLRGDEFNSIMEANPAFMREVAKALDTNVGELRKMAAEGKLTSDVIVKATEEIGGAIDEDFGKTVATVGESITNLRNKFLEFIGKIQSETGVFTIMSNAINVVADNLNIVVAILAAAFGAAVVGQIVTVTKTVIALGKSFQTAAKSAGIMQAIIGGPAGIAKVVGGLVAGGGALYLMDQMFEETDKSTENINKELDSAAKNAKDLEGSAKDALDTSNAQVQAEKDKKTAQDEAARIAENQLEDFKAITGELELGREELQRQLDLEKDLLFATDEQKEVISAISDLEGQRADALRDLNALTTVSLDERKAKEQEINDEYDERIKLTTQQLTEQGKLNSLIDRYTSGFAATNTVIQNVLDNIGRQGELMTINNLTERRAHTELANMYGELNDKRTALLHEMSATIQATADAQGKSVSQLTRQELDSIKEVFAARVNATEDSIDLFHKLSGTILQTLLEQSEAMRTFAFGFKEAFLEFEDTVNNAANFGRNVFETMTQGWEDAFVRFAETGKLSFKDLFKSLMTEIVKLMANKLFLALFAPGSGLFGDLFAGFFHQGGKIPAGKIGIVGERGPEIVRGPGTVIGTNQTAQMMGGGVTNVTYQIQAVDAPSFQALVARDPEFIYNVTRAGARRTPG